MARCLYAQLVIIHAYYALIQRDRYGDELGCCDRNVEAYVSSWHWDNRERAGVGHRRKLGFIARYYGEGAVL